MSPTTFVESHAVKGRIPALARQADIDCDLIYRYMEITHGEAQALREEFGLDTPDKGVREFERRRIDLIEMRRRGLLSRLAQHRFITSFAMKPKPVLAEAVASLLDPVPIYTPDQQKIANYLAETTGVGGGDDPVGFLITSHQWLREKMVERAAPEELRKAFQVWRDAVKAHEAAVHAYNERLRYVQERREAGDWSHSVTAQYQQMDDLQDARRLAEEAMAALAR